MSGMQDLDQLLANMEPTLSDTHYVFCTVVGDLIDYAHLNPLATYREQEGLTLVLEQSVAEQANLESIGPMACFTLNVHSSLEAVGLTAAVAQQLTDAGISANVIAAYFHDHIFVSTYHAQDALRALKAITADNVPNNQGMK